MRPASFNSSDEPQAVTRHTCWCGWSTTKRNRGVGGGNDLDVELLAHRLDHVEGRVPDDALSDQGRGS